MRLVFSRREELKAKPDHVLQVQKVTLGKSSLPGGLTDTFGLYGSDEWWRNIELGVAPVTRITGTIGSVFREGMHKEGLGFEIVSEENKPLFKHSCIANRKADRKLYLVGKKCELSYVTLPMKNPVRKGSEFLTHLDKVLEIWIEA